jgi:hypothetical protein
MIQIKKEVMEMKGCLRVVRGQEIKLILPGPSITVKSDGTLWSSGMPILGIEDATEKARIAELARAKKYDAIPAEYFTRLGDNPNGLWAGTDSDWDKHPLKAEQDRIATGKEVERAKRVRIYLSSRGWGDFSPCEWVGNITRPDAEILAECRHQLASGHDVDQPNQSDDEIMAKIVKARADWKTAPARKVAREAEEAADIKNKIETGYCFNCESWCQGDCGHYSSDPQIKFRRDLGQAICEQNYGIND